MGSLDRYTGPLYRRIADDLLDQVRDGTLHPGDKLPSERALCDIYSVSQITVRRALRELRHGGVLISRHGLGWYVQSGVPSGEAARSVALILPDLDWLSAGLARALAESLGAFGIGLRLVITGGDGDVETSALAAARGAGAAGVLTLPCGEPGALAARYAAHVASADLPLLLLGREVEGVHVPAAIWDEQEAVAVATRHLLDLGHQRVAYVGGDPAMLDGQSRYWGFANAIWDRGLDLPLDWVFAQTPGRGAVETVGRSFAAAFRANGRPTAIVCADDLQAVQVLARLEHLDLRCPADVAVASVGDRDFCPFLPTPLTSLRPDWRSLARAAAGMTRDLLAGRSVQSARFVGQLVQRQSSGASMPGPRQG